MKRNIRMERTYPVAPEHVYFALTDRDSLADWLMPNDFPAQAAVGAQFKFTSTPQGSWDGVTHCRILAFDPPRRLAYTWTGQRKDGSGPALADTTVTWTLTPDGSGTRLVLEHTGFQGFGEVLVSLVMQLGWRAKLRTKLPARFPVAAAA